MVARRTAPLLINFTDQGIRGVKDTIKRAHDFKAMAEKMGAAVKQEFWTIGRYDIIIIVEAPDVQTVMALCANVGQLGNIRTETLQAFTETEVAGMLKKMT